MTYALNLDDLINDVALFFESAVFQDVGDHIVSEFVRRQLLDHAQYLLGDQSDLIVRKPFHYALHDSTPILIFAELCKLVCGHFNDEEGHVARYFGDDTLDYVVTLRVVHALH